MTRKIHLRANKMTNGQAAYARCASRPMGNGNVARNSRRTYAFMASEIVGFDDFKNVSADRRCAHCMDMGLRAKNQQRRAKGLPLATSLFEKLSTT